MLLYALRNRSTSMYWAVVIKPNLWRQQMEGLAKNIPSCECDIWRKEEEDMSECEREDTGWKKKQSLTYCWYLHHSYGEPDGMRCHYGRNLLCIDTQMSKICRCGCSAETARWALTFRSHRSHAAARRNHFRIQALCRDIKLSVATFIPVWREQGCFLKAAWRQQQLKTFEKEGEVQVILWKITSPR